MKCKNNLQLRELNEKCMYISILKQTYYCNAKWHQENKAKLNKKFVSKLSFCNIPYNELVCETNMSLKKSYYSIIYPCKQIFTGSCGKETEGLNIVGHMKIMKI